MRVIVIVVALLGVALSKNLCQSGDEQSLEQFKSMGRVIGNNVVGSSCNYLSKYFDKVFMDGKCKKLTHQGMCYMLRAVERYGEDPIVTWDQLAGDIPNIAYLGELSCSHAGKCYKQIAKAVKKCMKSNPNFVEEVLVNAETLYRTRAESIVNEFIANHQNTLFGELANLAVANLQSINDIKALFAQYVDEDLQEQVNVDAQAAAHEVQKLAAQWCSSGCTTESADFLQSLFENMHGGQCLDAAQFCGPCHDNTNKYFRSGGAPIPCCLNRIFKKGIAAFDYVSAAYGARVDEWVGLVREQLSDEANRKAEEFAAEITRQADCISDAYNEHKPECG